MKIKMRLLASALVLCAVGTAANSATLTENFDNVPGWEAGWFGTNSNAQNCYGIGAGRGNNPDGLWVSNGGCSSQPVNVAFNTGFAAMLTSFSLDVAGFTPTTLTFYDKAGSVLSATSVALTFGALSKPGVYSHYSVTSSTGIGSFSFSGFAAGNTSIDNLVAVTGAAVPEPGSAALLLIGLGVVGAAARRRQATVVA